MVYTYNNSTKRVKPVAVPKLQGNDAKRVAESDVPKAFLKKVMNMKLNIERA